jgi:hypothetical protein
MKGFVTALVLLAAALDARDMRGADDQGGRATCFKAYVDEQALRDKGQLLAAHAAAVTCARDVCPALVSRDCVAWMRELDASIPSVAISVTDPEGRPRLDAAVSVDGAEVPRLDGTSLPLDPGSHRLHCELPGERPVDLQVMVLQGEHDRAVRIAFPRRQASTPQGASAARPIPVYVVALGATTILAAGVWAVSGALGLWANPSNRTLQQCYGHCPPGDVTQVKTELAIADIGAVAALALGAATVFFYLSRPAAPPVPSGTGDIGLMANVAGRF